MHNTSWSVARVAVLSAAAVVPGCARFDVPEGTPIACSSDDDCPSDFACRLERCLPVDSESVAPGLETTTINTALAGVDDDVIVSLVATEALAQAPQLSLVTASRRRAFNVTLDDTGLTATANVTVLADDDNGAAQIVATLVDRAGNQASDVLVGTVVLDTTAPRSVTVEANRTSINDDDDATVTITSSEPLSAASTMSIAGATVATVVEGNTLVAVITLTPAAPEAALIGQVQLVDLAGNAADVELNTLVAVDRTAPTLSLVGRTSLAGRGGVLSLTVSADEPLQAPPAAVRYREDGTGNDIDLEVTDTGGGVYRLLSRVTDDDTDGRWNVLVGFGSDLAGNVCDDLVVTDFVIDTTAPTFSTPPTVVDEAISRQPGHDATVLTFAVAEPARATVSLADGTELPCTDVDQINYTCSVAAEDIASDGAVVVFVEVSDEVGNRAFSSVGLVVDTVAPTLLGNTVELLPAAGALLDEVASLTSGAQLRVSFSVDDSEATVVARVAPDVLDFTTVQPDGSVPAFVASAVVPADIDDDTIALSLVLTDALGNSVTANLGGVVIDATAPATPPVDVVDAVVYRRVPWGSTETAGAAQFQIALSGLNAGDTVFAWASTTSAAPLASAVVEADGAARVDLGGNDRAEVFVNVVDTASNASPVVRVRDVAWTATMGRKVVGSTLANPHGFVQLGNTQDRLVVASANETGGAATAIADGQVATTTSTMRFQKAGGLTRIFSPHTCAAYDSARDRIVALPALDQDPETYEHDGQQWQQVFVADPESDGGPVDRQFGCAAAYHATRQVTLLTGGSRNPPDHDTWLWNGTSWRLDDDENGVVPGTKYEPALAYDDVAAEIVMFGGSNRLRDIDGSDTTFVWDGGWQAVCEGSCPRPSARMGAAMAFDAERGVVVLFGGRRDAQFFNDVWQWDGASWTEITPTDVEGDGNPGPRALASFGYDPVLRELVLVGGGLNGTLESGGNNVNDVWAFNGERFLKIDNTVDDDHDDEPPPQRAAVAVTTSQGLAVVGCQKLGFFACSSGDGPWLFNGTSFANGGTVEGPPTTKQRPALVFNRARGSVMMFGGEDDDALWEWNGLRWNPRRPAGDRPDARDNTALAYDEARNVVVLFGGNESPGCDGSATSVCGTLWEFNVDGTWTRHDPIGERPDPRHSHKLAYDAVRRRTVLFGGRTETATCDGVNEVACSTTWEWDGTWHKMAPLDVEGDGNPPGRVEFLLVFDRARGETVLVSGVPVRDGVPSSALMLTWTWNGVRWRLVPRSVLAELLTGGAAFYDPSRERVVVYGGRIFEPSDRILDWNGSTWSVPLPVSDPEGDAGPGARSFAGAAYDEKRGVTVVFGDATDPSTWLLRSAPDAIAQQYAFSFAAAGASADATFVSVDVEVTTATSTPNASLFVWDGAWQPLANTPLARPLRLSADADEIKRWLANPSATLNLALRGSPGDTQLEVDEMATTIRYRLP